LIKRLRGGKQRLKSICEINKSGKSVVQTSYDIIKAHGGVPMAIGIKADARQGEGTGFIIQLPLK